MKNKQFVSILLAIGILIIIAWLATTFSVLYTTFSQHTDERWKQKTTPLPKDRLVEICASLSILDDPLCQNEKSVYAPDFFPIVSKIFDRRETTYQDVQIKMGKYQAELDDLITRKDGSTYFTTTYDLRGDGVTSISFFFDGTYSENKLMKIEYHYDRFGF